MYELNNEVKMYLTGDTTCLIMSKVFRSAPIPLLPHLPIVSHSLWGAPRKNGKTEHSMGNSILQFV